MVGDLLHYLLEALLEFAAVLGACDQGPEVQRVDLFAREDLRHPVGGYLLRQTLDDSSLADTGLPDNYRVVLCPADQDLHNPLYLLAPADYRVELVLFGK